MTIRDYRHDTTNNRLSGDMRLQTHRSLGIGTTAPDNPDSTFTNPSGAVTVGDYEANWIAYLGYVPTWVHNYFYNVIGKQDEKWVG